MDDFSSPDVVNAFGLKPSEKNFIQPGKKMMSSMCPAIITDQFGNLRLLIGGAGGSKIISSVALVRMGERLSDMTVQVQHEIFHKKCAHSDSLL